MTDVWKLLDELDEVGLRARFHALEPAQLQADFILSAQEAEDLHYLLHRQDGPDYDPNYPIGRQEDNALLGEACREAMHSSFDGWDDPHDRVVLTRFCDDLLLYVKGAKELRQEDAKKNWP